MKLFEDIVCKKLRLACLHISDGRRQQLSREVDRDEPDPLPAVAHQAPPHLPP